MIYTYKRWAKFCVELRKRGYCSIPASQVNGVKMPYLVLKHDVETDVKRAFDISVIEYENGHRGSYYVQSYLLNDADNVQLLECMQGYGA